MQSAEPFIEAVGPVRDVVGVSAYRIGYRVHGTGEVIAAINIPAEIVEQAVTSKLSISVTMSPTGELSATSSSCAATFDSPLIPIDALVARVVAPEYLHLEEAGGDELRTLLVRLERSVTCVKDALARCGAR
ncbi:MAG: hypothetical protein WBW73_04430 [Rhodoplanes sp.]